MGAVGLTLGEDNVLQPVEVFFDIDHLGVDVREEGGHHHHIVSLHPVPWVRVAGKLQLYLRRESLIRDELIVRETIYGEYRARNHAFSDDDICGGLGTRGEVREVGECHEVGRQENSASRLEYCYGLDKPVVPETYY